LHVTPVNAGDCVEAGRLTRTAQIATGDSVEAAFVDQGYNGPNAASEAEAMVSNELSSNRQRRRRASRFCRIAFVGLMLKRAIILKLHNKFY
jgi:hypothetical protein